MIEVFGRQLQLVPSASSVQGLRGVSVVEDKGGVRTDLFAWDPVGQIVQYDTAALYAFIHDVKRSQAGAGIAVLWVTDLAIRVVSALRGLFGGSYGGTLGFGSTGGLVAAMSVALFVVASLAAAVVIAPLALLGWVLRAKIDREIRAETQRVLQQVSDYFVGQEPPPMAATPPA